MKLTPCPPAIVYIVLAAGAVLASFMKGEQEGKKAVLPTLVTMLTVTAVLQLLCQYGYGKAAWGLLVAMVALPLVLLFLMVLLAAWVVK